MIRDWEKEINLWIEKSSEDSELSIKQFCLERELPYEDFCRHWSAHEKYQPRYSMDKRFIGEGFKSTDNLILDERTIKAIQHLKCFVSPIRLTIVKYLNEGPNTILDFMKRERFAWFTTHQAFKYLERMGIVEVIGKQESFNVYRLSKKEAINGLLKALDALGAK